MRFLQEDAEEEVLQGEIMEGPRTAAVEEENALQRMLGVMTSYPWNLKPKDPGNTRERASTVQGKVQTRFLQEDAKVEVLQGGVKESPSSAVVEDEKAEQVLIWPGQNISPAVEEEEEEEEEEVTRASAWSQWFPAEEKGEGGGMVMKENMLGGSRKLSQENWSVTNGRAGSVTADEEPEGVRASTSPEETFLRAQHEPAEWAEDHQ
ncbi:hypothetical protein NFI96_004168 [Prochilodus magdalenae]|nr:hypothetical protein NFI96_004168 [Prochilodus magdalenae]